MKRGEGGDDKVHLPHIAQRWAGIQESNNEEAEAVVDVSGFKPSCHHFMTLDKLLCFHFFEDTSLSL